MTNSEPRKPLQPLCWLDLETTGTDERNGYILEIAAIMTESTPPFDELGSWSAVVRDESNFDWMRALDRNPTVRDMHMQNGLVLDILARGRHLRDVEIEFLDFLERVTAEKGGIRLAGSGVSHFDKRWIDYHLSTAHERFSYAPMDVGSVRRSIEYAGRSDLLLSGIFDTPPHETHRAMPDARRALTEFRRYTELIAALPNRQDQTTAPISLVSAMLTFACQDCRTPFLVRPDSSIDTRARFIQSYSDPKYIGTDYDPYPVLARIGQEIKIDGVVVHDCGSMGRFI